MKRIHYILLLLGLLVSIASCTDEALSVPDLETIPTGGRGEGTVTGDLVQQTDGTWIANARVALVGPGRIINAVGSGLVSAAGSGNAHLERMMDTDLTNAASFASSLATIEAGTPIVSVKDMYRTYAAGQKAGFIYRANSDDASLLTVDLLQSGFWLEFYNNGEKVGSTVTTGGGNVGVLNLGLLTFPVSGTGDMELALVAECDQPFDEVRMGKAGIDISALTTFEICYAFVGDNPEIPVTTSEEWFQDGDGVSINGDYCSTLANKNNLIDENLTNNVPYADVLVATPHQITVNLGKTIPAGYEVGFYFMETSVLNVGLLSSGTSICTYPATPSGKDNFLDKAGGNLTVLNLSLGIGSKRKINLVASKDFQQVMWQFYAGLLNLGGGEIYYAYIRQPMELDPSNYFTAADDVTSQNYYNLLKPQYGEVTYTILSQPEGATASIGYTTATNTPRLVGMNKAGAYRIKAIYTLNVPSAENEKQVMEHVFTITKEDPGVSCNQWMNQTSVGASIASPVDNSSGCLLCISTENKDIDNLIDADPTNFATYTGVLDLAANKTIVAVHLDNSIQVPAGDKIRTGFVIQAANELLNVDALKFFRVRLYNDGTEVTTEDVADENSTVNISLLGGDNGKIRYSVITGQPFNQIELWTSGVANIGLVNRLRIYGAFYESVNDCEESDATLSDVCMESMSPLNAGLDIDYANMKLNTGVAGVGGVMNGLENLLDGDKTTAAFSNNTLSLLAGTTLAVKFNPVARGQAIGIVLKHTGSVLDANVASNVNLKLFDDDVEIANTSTGGLADVNVISHGGYTTYEVIPNSEVNRMEFSLGSLLTAADNVSLSDIYLRPDSDGDGIPDCAEDEGEEDAVSLTYVGISEHVCEDRDAEGNRTGNGRIRMDMFGGKVGESYSLYYYAVKGSKTQNDAYSIELSLQEDSEGNHYFELELPTGEYYIGITDSRVVYNGAHAVVHPLQTIWLGTSSSDWNVWENWSEGTPWGCTNVIIPSPTDSKAIQAYNAEKGADLTFVQYPILADEENHCANIHFEPNAQVVNTLYLTYDAAFVDCMLEGGKEYLWAPPLKEMATGDWFIGNLKDGLAETVEDTYFTKWTDDNYEVNRFDPRVYQSFWSQTVYGMKADNSTTAITPGVALWTAPFNAVRQRYPSGGAFKIRAGATDDTETYTFWLPKYHNVYWYFNSDETKSGIYEDLGTANQEDDAIRTGYGGRFVYEPSAGEAEWPLSVTLVNEFTEGKDFLAGNPLMANLDILEFLKGNSNVTSIKIYNGTEYISIVNNDGTLQAGDGNSYTRLLPMQGFMVEQNVEGASCELTYTKAMFEASVDVRSIGSRSSEKPKLESLHLQAEVNGHVSSSLVIRNGHSSDSYRCGEDTRVLMDDVQTPVCIYTLCEEGHALDIQQVGNKRHIPVGIYLSQPASVTFRCEAGRGWKNWILTDKVTGQNYELDECQELTVYVSGSTDKRFYLEKQE